MGAKERPLTIDPCTTSWLDRIFIYSIGTRLIGRYVPHVWVCTRNCFNYNLITICSFCSSPCQMFLPGFLIRFCMAKERNSQRLLRFNMKSVMKGIKKFFQLFCAKWRCHRWWPHSCWTEWVYFLLSYIYVERAEILESFATWHGIYIVTVRGRLAILWTSTGKAQPRRRTMDWLAKLYSHWELSAMECYYAGYERYSTFHHDED